MWGHWKMDNSRCFALIATFSIMFSVCYSIPVRPDSEDGYGLNTLQFVGDNVENPLVADQETFQNKRAVFRMGKRAMMRFGKRAMMRFGKRAVFRLG